jgi:nitrogen fixation/metabolism regulation signal transduction histidine kinase
MSKGPFFKRKNYVINRTFQYGLISTFLISVLAALLLFSAGFTLYYWISSSVGDNLFKEFIVIHKQIEKEREVVNEEGKTVTETYNEQKILPPVKRIYIILPPLLINNLLIMIVIALIGIFFSHKIAGPAYRMITVIDEVLKGDISERVRLRKKDKLAELADKINLLLEEYERAKKE